MVSIDQFLSSKPILNLHNDPDIGLDSIIDYQKSYKNYIAAIKSKPHFPSVSNSVTKQVGSIPTSNTSSFPFTQEQMKKPRILETAEKLVSELRGTYSKRLEYEAKSVLYHQYARNHVFPKWAVNKYSPELLMNSQDLVHEFTEFRKHQAKQFLEYAAGIYQKHAETRRSDANWLRKRIIEKYHASSSGEFVLSDVWRWLDFCATKDKNHHERVNQMEYNSVAEYPLQYIWEGVSPKKFTIPPQARPPQPETEAKDDQDNGDANKLFHSAPQVRRGGRSSSRPPAKKAANQVQPLMSVATTRPKSKQRYNANRAQQPRQPRPTQRYRAPQWTPSTTQAQREEPNMIAMMNQNMEVQCKLISNMETLTNKLIKMNK